MTSGQEWDLTVPADDDELPPDAELPDFFGSFSGPTDLAERSREILDSEFPLTGRSWATPGRPFTMLPN